MSDDTTIRVSKKLRAQLDKIGHRESYGDIIERCVRVRHKQLTESSKEKNQMYSTTED